MLPFTNTHVPEPRKAAIPMRAAVCTLRSAMTVPDVCTLAAAVLGWLPVRDEHGQGSEPARSAFRGAGLDPTRHD